VRSAHFWCGEHTDFRAYQIAKAIERKVREMSLKSDAKMRAIEKVLDEVGAPEGDSIVERIRMLVKCLSDQPVVDPDVKILKRGWVDSQCES